MRVRLLSARSGRWNLSILYRVQPVDGPSLDASFNTGALDIYVLQIWKTRQIVGVRYGREPALF